MGDATRALASMVLVALALLAPARAAAQAHFPEMPAIESLIPSAPAAFVQETWTGTSPQHCWEYGFAPAERPVIEAALRASVRALGWSDADLDHGTMRHEGAVVAIVDHFAIDSLDRSRSFLKILVCTEGRAPASAQAAFTASMEAEPMWPALPFGPPYALWRRVYASGARTIGLALSLEDRAAAEQWFERAGYLRVSVDPLEMRAGRARVRFLGLAWWQHEDRAP